MAEEITFEDLQELIQQIQREVVEAPTPPSKSVPKAEKPTVPETRLIEAIDVVRAPPPPALNVKESVAKSKGIGPPLVLRCTMVNPTTGELQCSVTTPPEGGGEPLTSTTSESGSSRTSSNWLTLAHKYRNSIVQILADSAISSPLNPHESPQIKEAKGSGLFISKDGHILTNAHVVAMCIQCNIRRESEGERAIPANVLAVCPSKDLALLQLESNAIHTLKVPILPVDFGDSDVLSISSSIAAFGFQLGYSDLCP